MVSDALGSGPRRWGEWALGHWKAIDPVGNPGWGTTGWNFHQVAHYSNVYDACLRLDQSAPRIPRNEAINGTYKSDLYDSGVWTPGAPFSYITVD